MPTGVYARPPIADRFWAKVDRNGPIPAHCPQLGNCWLWTGATVKRTDNSYGVFRGYDQSQSGAHRFSYILNVGPIPDDLCVLHRCDARRCVRPDHLFLGTKRDNFHDMVAKGRNAVAVRGANPYAASLRRGERNHNTKLTADDVRGIRADLAAGMRKRDISAKYGITHQQVRHIETRKHWAHLP